MKYTIFAGCLIAAVLPVAASADSSTRLLAEDLVPLTSFEDTRLAPDTPFTITLAVSGTLAVDKKGQAALEIVQTRPGHSDVRALFVVIDCPKWLFRATAQADVELRGEVMRVGTPWPTEDAEMIPIAGSTWGRAVASYACGI